MFSEKNPWARSLVEAPLATRVATPMATRIGAISHAAQRRKRLWLMSGMVLSLAAAAFAARDAAGAAGGAAPETTPPAGLTQPAAAGSNLPQALEGSGYLPEELPGDLPGDLSGDLPGDFATLAEATADADTKQLVARGEELLELGDPASARLFFELAAARGSARAATGVGKTYDPAFFLKSGIHGADPDPGEAVKWYRQGISDGDPEAGTRLRELSLWLGLPIDLADPPTLEVQGSASDEDTPAPLLIDAALTDTDGSETLSVAIEGVPKGARLSAGQEEDGGRWSLAPADLAELTFIPPSNFSGEVELSVSATAKEKDGDALTETRKLPVTIKGVADDPTLTLAAADGEEGVAVPLDIKAVLGDGDGSESLSVTVGGLPEGATLSAGEVESDGRWRLAQSDLDGLTLKAAQHFSGEFTLAVSAIAEEADGDTAIQSGNLAVTITGIADTPVLQISKAEGEEDATIPLQIDAALSDTDGSESLSVSVTGLPEGATLSAGSAELDGSWSLEPADLAGLALTPAPHYSGVFELVVSATASEVDGSTASTIEPLEVSVASVPDGPSLSVDNVSGTEGETLPLTIKVGLRDTDGSETLALTMSGLPEGAKLSSGQPGEDGTWKLDPATLGSLRLSFSRPVSGEFDLTVDATATEEDGASATNTDVIKLALSGVADPPVLDALASAGEEDNPVPLQVQASLNDIDGSETLALSIVGVPKGATLSAGRQQTDGSWLLAAEDQQDLTLIPAPNYSGRFPITVTATSTETGGDTASTTASAEVWVASVPDEPELTVENAQGEEGATIPINIVAALADTDGSETLAIAVAGVPDGTTFSAGHRRADRQWHLDPEHLGGLSLTPGADVDERLSLTVSATASEADGGKATVTETLEVAISKPPEAPQPPAVEQIADNSTSDVVEAVPPEPVEQLAAVTDAPAEAEQTAALPAEEEEADTFGIQLSSIRTAAGAEEEVSRLQKLHADLLTGLDFDIQAADIEGRGVFHRIYAGPFFNRTTAEDLCGQLEVKDAEQYCLVVRHAFGEDEEPAPQRIAEITDTTGQSDAVDTQAGTPAGTLAGSQGLILEVQQQLKLIGYDPGQVDGKLGPQTSASIMQYQETHRLSVDGKPSEALLEHLEATAKGKLQTAAAVTQQPTTDAVAEQLTTEAVAPEAVEEAAEEAVEETAAETPSEPATETSTGNRGVTIGITIPIGAQDGTQGGAQDGTQGADKEAAQSPTQAQLAEAEPASEQTAAQPPAAEEPVRAQQTPSETQTAAVNSAEIDLLMSRGNDLLGLGDPASARLFYELAAASGSVVAATAVGKTFDPLYHAEAGIHGALTDPGQAKEWYTKAASAGDEEAAARLRSLTDWMVDQQG